MNETENITAHQIDTLITKETKKQEEKLIQHLITCKHLKEGKII